MKIKPMPGNMIVKLESLYKNTGLIHIPQRFRKAPHLIGTITAISMRPEDKRTLGVDLVVGNRIIVTPLGGRHLSDNEWIYPISMIRKDVRGKKYRDSGVLAIVPDSVNLSVHSQDVERCQFCGDARPGAKQNILMVNGVCPRCGKDKQGEIPDDSIKVTGAESERLDESVSRYMKTPEHKHQVSLYHRRKRYRKLHPFKKE